MSNLFSNSFMSKSSFYRYLRNLAPSSSNVNDLFVFEIPVEDREYFASLSNEEIESDDELNIGSDCEDSFPDPIDNNNSLNNEGALTELRYIVCKNRLSVKSTNDILRFLNKYKDLNLNVPKTYSSLMKTPHCPINVISVGKGEYVHLGIQEFFTANSHNSVISSLCKSELGYRDRWNFNF